jgi:hypothetical protein
MSSCNSYSRVDWPLLPISIVPPIILRLEYFLHVSEGGWHWHVLFPQMSPLHTPRMSFHLRVFACTRAHTRGPVAEQMWKCGTVMPPGDLSGVDEAIRRCKCVQ